MFGHDLDRELEAAKACIGIVPQEINFNQFETPQTILVNQAGFYGIERPLARERAEKYLSLLQLADKRNKIARGLSGGMKRRLMIARALVHEPRLLILDEPTAGVDIEIRRSMWEFLREINARGTTIILTTHYLEEAETLCRNIAIINGGLIAERDRMSSLLRKLQAETFVLNLREAVSSVPQIPGYEFELVDEHTLEVEVSKEQSLNEVFAKLSEQGIGVLSMRNKVNRLEEMFMKLVEAQTRRGGEPRHERPAHPESTGAADSPRALGQARWTGLKTIIIREYGRIIRIWAQTIVPSAVTSALYFVIFGSLIGKRVGLMGGVPYMQYIAPGLIMMAVITNSYGNVVSSFFGAKFGKHVEEMLVAPLPNWIIVLGYVGGGLVRGMLVGGAVTIVSLIFTQLHVHHALVDPRGGGAHVGGVRARRLHQRAVRQEFRPGELDPDLRADAADVFRRRVLFDHAAAGMGAAHLVRESHPAHGQRVPLRLPRHQRRQRVRGIRHHADVGAGAVRRRACSS